MKIIDLTKDSFVEKVADYQSYPDSWNFKGNKPCLVDFHAPWCVYCKALSPILDQLAKEYEGKMVVGKCDIDENPDLPAQFGVRNIPTILFIKNGEVVDKSVGALPKNKLQEKFEALASK